MFERVLSSVGRLVTGGTQVTRPYFGDDAWEIEDRRTELIQHSRTFFD